MAAPRGTSKNAGISWRSVTPAPLILLQGSEELLASRAFETVRTALRGNAEIEMTRFEANSYERGELLLASSPSLFSETKLIEIRQLGTMNEDFLNDALSYAKSPAPDATLVMHHSGGVRGKKLLDALKAAGAIVVDCQPLKKDAEKIDFVAQEFRTAKRKLTAEGSRALVAALGSDLSELAAACSQLLQDTTGAVDQDVVDKYYGGRVEATGFKVADAALAGRADVALSTLRHALATGTDPVPIVATLAMKLRQVAKVAGVRKSSGQLASELGMAPWQVQQAQEQARNWKAEDLARCIRLVAEADAQVKGASRDPEYAVERAVMQISLAARH
ncbi:DNA polymerase III subunit delta [Paeniglutamicibacter terrestris]|uniref:DNA-directed DNA polymerase n=1 Tax=Paeniglutamicibacter terrestris TaxID=2723403 RepID=A0ABX1G4D0_9MICC|nr:DNA polymerase III subunit delta [Paeniglutamicibacter terrestris]ASN39302.1 DNA polymerase III subunit delta [Arthrobacter sp. 7749]NKG20884.1 DNA polymerase III subunit delta [Paeniglutamicibacter terrestris]